MEKQRCKLLEIEPPLGDECLSSNAMPGTECNEECGFLESNWPKDDEE